MLLATSISFDGALTKYPVNGTLCSLGGLLFSVLLTEGLLRGLAIRLPILFRVPYYLALALFYVYPVAPRWAPFFSDPYEPSIQWALLFISLGKTGLLQRRLTRLRERQRQGRPRADAPDP